MMPQLRSPCLGTALRHQTALSRSLLPLKSRRSPPPVMTARWWCPLTKSANLSPNATRRRGQPLSRRRPPLSHQDGMDKARRSPPPSAGAVPPKEKQTEHEEKAGKAPPWAASPRRPPRSRIPRLASPGTKCPEGNGAKLARVQDTPGGGAAGAPTVGEDAPAPGVGQALAPPAEDAAALAPPGGGSESRLSETLPICTHSTPTGNIPFLCGMTRKCRKTGGIHQAQRRHGARPGPPGERWQRSMRS